MRASLLVGLLILKLILGCSAAHAQVSYSSVPSERYIRRGRVLGTWIGFGLGHDVQGRNGDVYMVGETAALGIVASAAAYMGAAGGLGRVGESGQAEINSGAKTIFWAGAALYGAFRIVEAIDVLSYAPRGSTGLVSFNVWPMVAPDQSGVVAILNF